jgi:hypothetical protein
VTGFTVNSRLRVGDRREAAEAVLRSGLDGDSDEFSSFERMRGGDVWLGYDYDDGIADRERDVKHQRVVSLVVEFARDTARAKAK